MAAVAGFLGAAIQVVKCVGKPIKHQFNYLCCFSTNITNLEKEAKKLDDAEGGIQVQVDRALDDVRVIVPQVKTWLAKSKEIKDEKTAILDQVPNVGSVCLNLRARFSLSKRATKTADHMKELRDECSKFDVISLPGPPAAREVVELSNAYEFESRKKIEGDIMTILREGDVRLIGICGMGGLGKTTMAKRIMNRVLEEHVFEETVIAVFSQQVDKPKIQIEIGGSLGVNLEAETSEAGRKQKLHARLSGTKRILLVLDDVWKPIKLEEFGIPCDSKGCTVLITSRNIDTLRKMGVEKNFGMEILSDEDARILFRKKAGTCMDDAKVKSMAEGVVKKCGGLPIALVTVGATLKDEKDPRVWSNALRELSQRVPDYIDEYIVNVYKPLRLSYDFLSSEMDKSIFLLCCLFPEDAKIDVEKFICFGVGLGIFEGIRGLEDARDSVSASITRLRGRSLLLDGEESDDYVRMHDVVRDVCIFIAKQEERVEGSNSSWISSFEQLGEGTKLPTGFRSPNLNLLFLSCLHNHLTWRVKRPKLNNTIFEGISDLRVLCIQYYQLLKPLPSAHTLKNLKSLVLVSCNGLKTISFVGELVNLEILICRDCSPIEELPFQIKGLDRLKLFELTRCRKLQRIGQGVISSLVELEELRMLDSFKKWGSEDREERKNAGLRELEALTNLRCLEIEIEDPALAVEKIHLSSKIKRFHIGIGTSLVRFGDPLYNKKMILELKREDPYLGNSIWMQFLRDTEYLVLEGSGANSMDLAKCQNIRWLELMDCETITLVVDDVTVLPASLENLKLRKLPKLEGICDGSISSNSFHNLKELTLHQLPALKQLWKSSSDPPLLTNLSSISIEGCDILCNLGQLSMAGKDFLPQLQDLVIKKCEKMEQVFLWNKIRNDSGSQNDHCIIKVFPKLKKIGLCDLPNLATFYQGMGGFEFPLLTKLSIEECPKLKSMGCSVDIDDDSSHLFCQPEKVSFGNIKELSLKHQWNPLCGHEIHESLLNGLEVLKFSSLYGSTSLFSSSVAENLVNMRILEISGCDEMLKVIEDNKKVVSGNAQMPLILFPKLEVLSLQDLPKLVNFCEWKCDVKLPSLWKMIIRKCPDMKNLSLEFLAAPKLDHFDSDFEHNLESEVSFDSLKILVIKGIEKPLYGHKIFNGLKELQVSKCSTGCLFASSIARNLDCLEELYIYKCEEMVKVIEDEDEDNVGSGGERTLLFPKLKTFELRNLPKLVSFCEWKCDIELPSLRDVKIASCPDLKIFSIGSIAIAPNLNSLLKQLEYIERVEVSFGNIKELSIKHQWNPFCGHKTPLSLFSGLEVLEFSMLYGSTYLFSSSIARNLVNVRVLNIKDCDEMLKVFEDNRGEDESTAEMPLILFPKLEELRLEDLPKLVSFCDWKCDIKLPSLRELTVRSCPDMKNLSLAAPKLDWFKTDFEHNLEIGVKVPFDSLEKLEIRGIEKPLHSHKFFNGLKEMQVMVCTMSYIFTSSMARCLDCLEELTLYRVREMVKVIEDEENEEEVGSGGERTLLFPKLNKLVMINLLKLVSFCEWKCDIELPSLREVRIYDCPVLRNFTMGSIAAAPNLENVLFDNDDFGGDIKELNSVAQENMVRTITIPIISSPLLA